MTAYRHLAQDNLDLVPLDFDTPFFAWLVTKASERSFGGLYAARRDQEAGALAVWQAKYQDESGAAIDEELLVFVSSGARGGARLEPEALAGLLLQPTASAMPPSGDWQARRDALGTMAMQAEAAVATNVDRFRHPNDLLLLAAADNEHLLGIGGRAPSLMKRLNQGALATCR